MSAFYIKLSGGEICKNVQFLIAFFILFNSNIEISFASNSTIAPSLLIDVTLNNSSPGATEQFCYKVRYRCASTTEHCTDAYIDLTLPEGMEISVLPDASGNITLVTVSPGSPSGTYVRIDLESGGIGLPPGTLAAGSSGIFNVCAKWICNDGSTQAPAAGSSINITGPTFNASSASVTATPAVPINVPVFASCPVPGSGGGNGYEKRSDNVTIHTNPGGIYFYNITVPAHEGPVSITDSLPDGLLLSDVRIPAGWNLELMCDTSWVTIPSGNSYMTNWLYQNVVADALDNLLIDPSLPATPANETGCSADTVGVSEWYGSGMQTDFKAFRMTSPSGTNLADYIYVTTAVEESVVPGTILTNCAMSTDTTMGYVCTNDNVLVRDGVISYFRKNAHSHLGSTSLPNEIVNNYPNLSKQHDDILWSYTIHFPQNNGELITGFTVTDTLPIGLTYDTSPANGNWHVSGTGGTPLIWDEYDAEWQDDCVNPTFTTSLAPDGRTVLEWNFNTCTVYPGFTRTPYIQMYFTSRYDKTIPLPTEFINDSYLWMDDGAPIICGGNTPGEPAVASCEDPATSPVNPIGGDIYSTKGVQGAFDSSYSTFPNVGRTDTFGTATYELLINIGSLEGVEKLEIVDILPHVGDSTLISRVPRNSEWSLEIAGPLIFEKYDIVTNSWVSAAPDISNELYATSYNPCYMNAAMQVKATTGLTEPASASCLSTDFSASNPNVGAKGFAFTWENAGDPLAFGEILRVQFPVQQLSGEAKAQNGEISSNSFAITATETDGDELFSSEPLKVNLQMLDPAINVSIGDYVWLDANANGIQDGGELPLSGVTISLYDDTGNAVLISGIPQTVITDASGYYSFSGLDPNTDYYIRLDDPDTYQSGGPLTNLILTNADMGTNDDLDSDAVTGDGSGLFATVYPEILFTTGMEGTTITNLDIGFYQPATICGYAWEDADNEGDQDGSELPMDSVMVELVDVNGVTIAIDTTDILGLYSFTDVPPGLYNLEITFLGAGGYLFTVSNQATNDNEDSDVTADGIIGPIIVEGFDYTCNHDVGLVLPLTDPATIIGTVWDELTNDGIQNGGELGVEGIQVNLLDAAQFVIATTYTDVNGDYIFGNLEPNLDYYVNVVPGINNPITSPQDAGADDTIDSDVDPITGTTFAITPTSNQIVDHVDAGIVMPYSLGNQVWLDTNGNGINDAGEGVVANVMLYLYDATTSALLDSTITDANGKFVFTGLTPNDYYVELELPNGIISTDDIASSTTPNTDDNDDNGVVEIASDIIQSSVITIVAGGGTAGDPNWIESDHGQPINGVIDNTSNPKAYYTLDFGLQNEPDCSIPLVQYAITNGAISKPGQTTNYFYQDTVQNLKTYVNHISMVQQNGVIRCADYCEFGSWRYYYNPMDPDEYLFAIEHGTNVTPIEYIELRVEDVPSDRYAVSASDATYVMSRDWFVRTVNDAPLEDASGNPTTVNIRFYFPEEEFKEIIDAAIAQATVWGGTLPTISDVYWFKRNAFDVDADIDAQGSLLLPNSITSLRNATTSALGVNSADGLAGQTGNGKNHIQFNGINGFSGGTAAITINKNALPVAVSSFEVQDNGCNALLQWSSESETDFSHYIVERSTNGIDFEFVQQILSLKLTGTTGYSYTDENINGEMFYRLKMLNLDGTYKYTDIILVSTSCENQISNLNLYPNPIGFKSSNLNVSFINKKESVVWITISNLNGTELMKFPTDAMIGDNTVGIDISNINAGTYIVAIQKSKGKVLSKQFVKVRE